jgi:hypothetical protein
LLKLSVILLKWWVRELGDALRSRLERVAV